MIEDNDEGAAVISKSKFGGRTNKDALFKDESAQFAFSIIPGNKNLSSNEANARITSECAQTTGGEISKSASLRQRGSDVDEAIERSSAELLLNREWSTGKDQTLSTALTSGTPREGSVFERIRQAFEQAEQLRSATASKTEVQEGELDAAATELPADAAYESDDEHIAETDPEPDSADAENELYTEDPSEDTATGSSEEPSEAEISELISEADEDETTADTQELEALTEPEVFEELEPTDAEPIVGESTDLPNASEPDSGLSPAPDATNVLDPEPAPEPEEPTKDEEAEPADSNLEPAFYVSPDGDDDNPGTIDQPFATLEAARDAMRADPDISTTYIREGTYYQESTLYMGAEDSGSTFAAYPGESPVISGGELVTGFQYEGEGIYSANLDEPLDLELKIGGERQKVTQTGDWDPEDPYQSGWSVAEASGGGSKSALVFDEGALTEADFTEGITIEVASPERWETHITTVEFVDFETNTIYLADESKFTLDDGSTYRLLGNPEHIQDEGEFAYRDSDGRLVVKPENSDTFEEDGVVVPRLEEIIRIENAEDVTIVGLSFEDGIYEGEAIYAKDSENITIANNSFTNVGAGVKLSGTDESYIVDNTMDSLGRSGIEMYADSSYNIISGNIITHVGEIIKDYGAIFSNDASHNTISYNDISYTARYGISFKDSGSSENIGNVIEYNVITYTNQETADTGAIEFLGRSAVDTETTIRHNYIEDTGGLGTDADGNWIEGYQSSGIYLDDSTSGVEIYGNFITEIGWAAIHVHGGDDVAITNNVAILGDEEDDNFVQLQNWKNQPSGDVENVTITQNIIFSQEPQESYVRYINGGSPEVDENILYNVPQYNVPEDAARDLNSILADPGFVDAASGDYTLTDDSIALSLGFLPLETELGAAHFDLVTIVGVEASSALENYLL